MNHGNGENRGRRAATIAVLTLILLVVTIVVIQTIQKAPVAGAGGPPGGDGPPQMPPAAVYTTVLEAAETREEAVATGIFHPISRAEVAAREPGLVEAVLVEEGDAVKQGAVLARLDRRRLDAALAEARARVAAAETLVKQREVQLRRAEEDLRMKKRLADRKAVSESDLLDAEEARTVAQAQERVARDGVKEAQSRLAYLDVQLADLVVTAPFDGVVVSRHAEPGEWVGAGATVATMVTMNPIEAWLRVPARYLSGTNADMTGFRVRRSSTGEILTPSKAVTVPDVDGRSQLFTLVATLDNAGHRLAPGESVTGIVPVGRRQAYWKIPVDAVVQSPTGTIVQTVQPAEGEGALPIARPQHVQVAFERGGMAYVAVADVGFKAGDQIVVEGNERLRPGQPLMVKPAGEAPATKAP